MRMNLDKLLSATAGASLFNLPKEAQSSASRHLELAKGHVVKAFTPDMMLSGYNAGHNIPAFYMPVLMATGGLVVDAAELFVCPFLAAAHLVTAGAKACIGR
ncbi:MAG TPA: hypothetical protein VLC93_09585 [Myxococcota bacterium]|nr:hypothetical protein [Myxococcota bacterium]